VIVIGSPRTKRLTDPAMRGTQVRAQCAALGLAARGPTRLDARGRRHGRAVVRWWEEPPGPTDQGTKEKLPAVLSSTPNSVLATGQLQGASGVRGPTGPGSAWFGSRSEQAVQRGRVRLASRRPRTGWFSIPGRRRPCGSWPGAGGDSVSRRYRQGRWSSGSAVLHRLSSPRRCRRRFSRARPAHGRGHDQPHGRRPWVPSRTADGDSGQPPSGRRRVSVTPSASR
jgi:hypothetical protein